MLPAACLGDILGFRGLNLRLEIDGLRRAVVEDADLRICQGKRSSSDKGRETECAEDGDLWKVSKFRLRPNELHQWVKAGCFIWLLLADLDGLFVNLIHCYCNTLLF